MEYFDVIVVGAGISGIGSACHLQTECPGHSYVILEGRANLGGTWDLFQYPGLRSDSDMYTMAYKFKPWLGDKILADGSSILSYLHETAIENKIDKKIRYQHHVKSAEWSSSENIWTIEVLRKDTTEMIEMSCNFILMCSGYYSYKGGYTPNFKGRDDFKGQVIHPQAWPEDLDYSNKRVVVVGSGATAVSLIPALTSKTEHVTMVQRSPSYVLSLAAKDRIANLLRKILPNATAYKISRWNRIRLLLFLYRQSRARPALMKRIFLNMARRKLGPGIDFDTHFTPRYDPWDQRLCVARDGDFFTALRSGKASIVTDQIDRFTCRGLLLNSGEELPADIIVTATGFNLAVMGEVDLIVDGRPIDLSRTIVYKGCAFAGVPNLWMVMGYMSVSWTLRVDLVVAYACRLLNHMSQTGTRQCRPCLRESDHDMESRPIAPEFTSGYLQRSRHKIPKQGDREPWLFSQDYTEDKKSFLEGAVDDGVMEFTS